jgi:hypothetical protein
MGAYQVINERYFAGEAAAKEIPYLKGPAWRQIMVALGGCSTKEVNVPRPASGSRLLGRT